MVDLEIIIPVLNEERAVAELVSRINSTMRSDNLSYRMIFVDDHSTDDTLRILKKLKRYYPITIFTKQGKPGKAFSIFEGAKATKSKTIAMIDGDLQYPPEVIPQMYRLTKRYGIVVANRKKDHLSFIRRLLSNLNSQMIGKYLLGLHCDSQSGLKVFKKEIIEELEEKNLKPWALDMPLLYSATKLNHKIGSVEIDFADRVHGKSKVNFIKTTFEITSTAIALRFSAPRIKPIPTKKKNSMIGAGVFYKNNKYITHTTLSPQESALFTLTRSQQLFIATILLSIAIGILLNTLNTSIIIIAVLSLIYFLDVIFGMFVLIKSLHHPPELVFKEEEINSLSNKDLPTYTILCPLYKEGNVLPDFIQAIRKLDWPKHKLDVLILLEKDDKETLETAETLKLPKYIRVIVVPDSQPRTKPKACNYGLLHAKGEYVVIFDAEDKPDPLQLKKAFLGFKQSKDNVFCLQSKLNYYNSDHNILTRLFTAEYSLWFDILLPGLQSIKTTIPLGGTSNHFKTKDLIAMKGWDPFNVTEDCDLGTRIFKAGYTTAIIDSTTYEEANSSIHNWIRQRSRWIKGYMQTYLVHMRNPFQFFKEHGIHALIFQLIIGMRISFMLINPFLWLATFIYFAFRPLVGEYIEALYPTSVFYIAIFSLIVGNFMYIFNYMIGCAKREHYDLIKYVFLIPLYWILASIASFKAIQQLIFKPHFWEKTHHGLHLPAIKEQPLKQDTEIKKKPVFIPSWLKTNPIKYLKISFINRKTILNTQTLGVSFLVGSSVLTNFSDFLTNAYLGRTLGPEEFGLIGLMTSFMFIVSLVSSGIGNTVAHQSAYLFGKFNYVFSEIWTKYRLKVFKISLIFTLLWSLAVPFSGGFFNSYTLIPFILFMPVWIVLMLGSWDSGYLEGSQKFVWLSILAIISSVSKLVFSILFVELGMESMVYGAMPISLLISFLGSWLVARKISLSNKKKTPAKAKDDIKFSKKFFTTSILTKISSISFLSLDIIFIKHFLTASEAGQYAVLVLVGRIVYIAGGFFSQLILPIISKERGQGLKKSKSFPLILGSSLLSTIGAFLLVGPLGSFTVPLLFGDRANPILPYVTTFAFAMILFSTAYTLINYHQARKEYEFSLIGVLTVFVQLTVLSFLHANIGQVVTGMLFTSIFFLIASLLMHIYYEQVLSIKTRLLGLYELFTSYNPTYTNTLHTERCMKILIYNWRDTKHVWAGGAEVYVQELAKQWVKQGHCVTLFCGNDTQNKRYEVIDGVNIIRRGGFYTVYLWAVLYYLLKFRGQFDFIIDSENGIPFFTPLFTRTPKIGLIHHVHSDIILKELKLPITKIPPAVIAKYVESKLMPLIYRNTQMVTVSESSKRDMEKLGFGKSKPIMIVNPGIDLSILKPSRKSKAPTLLYLGRLKPYKSIDTLIKAVTLLTKTIPDLKVNIAGFGESREELEALTKSLGLQKQVKFLGRVSERAKIKLLGEAWVFVQPSTMEGWGISVLEANACGTPVVASKVPGLIDSVKNPSTGYTVKVHDEKAFAKAIKKLLDDNKLRKRFSANSIEWAKNFSWDIKAKDFMGIVGKEMTTNSLPLLHTKMISNKEYEIN